MVDRYKEARPRDRVLPEATLFRTLGREEVEHVIQAFVGDATSATKLEPRHIRTVGDLLYRYRSAENQFTDQELKLISTLIKLCEDSLHTGRYIQLVETQPDVAAQAAFVVNVLAKLKERAEYRHTLVDFDRDKLLRLVEQVDQLSRLYLEQDYLRQEQQWSDTYQSDESAREREQQVNQRVRAAQTAYRHSARFVLGVAQDSHRRQGSADGLYLLKNAFIAADVLRDHRPIGLRTLVIEAGRQGEAVYDYASHNFVVPGYGRFDHSRATDRGLMLHFDRRPLVFSGLLTEHLARQQKIR